MQPKRKRRPKSVSQMLKTTFDGEVLLHRLLWQIVEEEQSRAGDLERGWFNPSLVAMIFAFHTVEAYLNYVGERLAPDIWKKERNFFRNEPYGGFEGKLRKVLELVGLQWAPGKTPLATILQLKTLRDLIAHGKPEKLKAEISHPEGTEPPVLASTLRKMVTPRGKLKSMLSDVQEFLVKIHDAAKSRLKVRDHWFGEHPLKGTSEYVVRSTKLMVRITK